MLYKEEDNRFLIIESDFLEGHTAVDMYSKLVKVGMKHDSLSCKELADRCYVVRKMADLKSEVNQTRLISKPWNNCTGNKLQSINPTIGVYQHVRSLSRRNAVIIHRLRIGHTRLTHSYLLSGTDQPECSACHCPLTVKHILIECPALTSSRKNIRHV